MVFLGVCSGEGQICQIPFLYSGQLHFQCSTQAPGGEQDHRGRCPVRLLDQDTREASDQVNIPPYLELLGYHSYSSHLTGWYVVLAVPCKDIQRMLR